MAGILGITKNIVQIGEKLLIPSIQRRVNEETFKKGYCIWKIVNVFYTFVMFACLVVGSYFIYSNYGKLENSGNYRSDLCHEGLYKFAFGITTACFVLATLLICCVCCCGLCQVHDQRNVSAQQRHRLNNETTTHSNSENLTPTLNAISNPIQNGRHSTNESNSPSEENIIEENITPVHANHTDNNTILPNSHQSHYTQETIV